MSGVNKVILIGNLGGDPEMRAMPNGSHVTNLSIATSRSWKDKESGEQRDRAEWHRIVFFNKLAEIANQYLEGELRTQEWERDGQKHFKTEVVASEMQMLDSKQKNDEENFNDDIPF